MNPKYCEVNFDYNLVKVLDAVITAGNAAKASKQLSVTPAAVSLALTRLQHFYNEELFVRGKHGLVPTMKALEVHKSFRQAIELVNETIKPDSMNPHGSKVTILGGDIIENYYLSQIYDDNIFDRFILRHFSRRNMNMDEIKRRLITGSCDLVMSTDIINEPYIKSELIDSFKDFACVCSSDNLLGDLTQLSLHNFYAARHALYQSDLFKTVLVNDDHLFGESTPYKGQRVKGYQSDSISGIISIIERTSLIALLPLKLAAFFKGQRKCAIKIIEPPAEMIFKPINIYASWDKRNPNGQDIEEIVTILHTLSTFRR
nr:LysR family transcriptional regulator [uncultured Enterobacter sp.]